MYGKIIYIPNNQTMTGSLPWFSVTGRSGVYTFR